MMQNLKIKSHVGFSFIFALLFFVSPQIARADLSLTSGDNATTTPNVATAITGFQIVGPAASTTPVKLFSTSGTLSMTATSGLTFDGAYSGSVVYFSGTVANINAALSTLTYSRSSTGTDTLEVSLVPKGEAFFTSNNHLYKFVSGSYTWSAAKTAAESTTAYGATGYLATITSQAENDFVSGRLTGDGWIGASDSAVEGTWKWMTGPEAGTTFWQGTGGGSTVGGNYAHWSGGEPNQSGDEDCAETYVSGGTWNDLPCSVGLGYVVEYGTPSSLPTVVAKNISIVTADVPAVTSLSPANASTSVAVNANLQIVFSKTVSKNTGDITIRRSSDNSIFETINVASSTVTGGGTNTITIDPVSTLEEGVQYYVTVPGTAFKDGSNNLFDGISGTSTWVFTTQDITPPIITNVATSTVATTSATITWTTNEAASSNVVYSPSTSYNTSLGVTDTSPRVTSHSRNITGLVACTNYYFKVVSADAFSNQSTSSAYSFTTIGCVGQVTPSAATSTLVAVASAATSTLAESGRTMTVTTPANFTSTSSSIVIQIKSQTSESVIGTLGTPSTAIQSAAGISFNVTALIDNSTVLDSFSTPVTISYTYTDADIAGLDESTLVMYHYHNGEWIKLTDCSVNAATNTITCTTPSFSVFAIFGSALRTGSGTGLTSASGIVLGCKDPKASNYQMFVRHRPELCQYATSSASVVSTASSSGFSRDLNIGMKGEDVRLLQKKLNSLGFKVAASGPGSAGNETNMFGSATRAALIRFQTVNNIKPAIGYFGSVTRGKMMR